MKLYEYQAKNYFRENQIPVPNGIVCSTENEAKDAFTRVGKEKEVVLKSQVLVGGRGKSGGIKSAKSVDEIVHAFKALLGMNIKGLPVSKVLIEEKIEIKNEYYVGFTIDPTASQPILLISSKGGMEVETIAKESPSALYQYIVNPRYGVPSYQILKAMNELSISREISDQLIDVVKKLYKIFCSFDATLTEINPLVESSNGKLIAVDARLNIDNNALFKHPGLEDLRKEFSENKETYLKGKGVDFVYVGGNIGLICAGAGMTMATMDLVNAMGGKSACFCDVSAGINPQSMELAMKTVSDLEGVKSILVNMFGGLTRMDEVANSFVVAWKNMGGISIPVVMRLEGTNVEEGRRIMKENGFEMFTNLYDAVRKAVELGVE
jgi:succinyl-CoA synthetase beta subunit